MVNDQPPVVADTWSLRTEYAIRMSDGAMQVRNDHPEVDRIYPLELWVTHRQRFGGTVYRRRVIVVADWEEVP